MDQWNGLRRRRTLFWAVFGPGRFLETGVALGRRPQSRACTRQWPNSNRWTHTRYSWTERRPMVCLTINRDPSRPVERDERAETDTEHALWAVELEPVPELADYDPSRFGFIEIGTITGPHGVRGECKVRLSTDFVRERLPSQPVQRYLKLSYRVYPRPVQVQDGRPASQPNQWIIRIHGVDDRDAAKRLRGASLYIHETEERPRSLTENEYTIREWLGRAVILRERLEMLRAQKDFRWTRQALLGHCIGKVIGVVLREDLGGAHDSLELLLFEGYRRLDVPFVDAFITEWNSAEMLAPTLSDPGTLPTLAVLDPPPGLLALAQERKRTKPPRIRGYLPPCRSSGLSDGALVGVGDSHPNQ